METEMETKSETEIMELEKGIKKISEETQWLLDSQRNKDNRHNQHSQSICRVPEDISGPNFQTKINVGLFAIDKWPGPDYSHVKIRYMFDLFESLKSPPDEIMNECMQRVHAKLDRITACYDEDVITDNKNYSYRLATGETVTESFIVSKNMVIDACYILGLIHKWSEYIKHEGSSFSDKFLVSLQTKLDLIGLPNHIPFFVLQDIFECTILKLDPTASLVELILSFLKDINPFEANSITGHRGIHDTDYKHILDLLYKTYQPPDARSSDRLSTVTTTYSAVELRKAGVKFKAYQGDKWKMDIKFNSSWSNTTLTMPAMRIEESTVPVLWNLALYERSFPEVGNYIASYSFAMMMLVDTKEDLLELVESKVIRNPSGHQYIVDNIHEICKGVFLKEFSYAKEWQKMNNYCNSCLGYTRRTYFSGAWSYIASVSALILFILTAVQTYCSIRAL